MTSLRILTIGGLISYRALFNWLRPGAYVFTVLVPSITTLAFFVFLGRGAHIASDSWYVAGNALVAAAGPSIFGMAQAVAGERYTHTLALLVVSPANRVAVFLGRALPATLNGIVVSAWAFTIGSLLFGVSVPGSAVAPLALTIVLTAASCVGLGLITAALGLRWRDTGVFGNVLLYVLLLFAGVNIPLDRLPGWLSTLAQGLPVTHGARAARELVGGASLGRVLPLLGAEALVGAAHLAVGLAAIRLFETEARRGASLEVA
jgi:ABC-2 type transport system permease protein